VNAIAPGLLDRHDEPRAPRSGAPARFYEQVPAPLGRRGDDIKGAAVFLASDAAAFVTGHTLIVDGGMLAR
jgi:2-deoxy-D-gluconate 3-dehydrogenase